MAHSASQSQRSASNNHKQETHDQQNPCLYIGNIDKRVNQEQLRSAFEVHGSLEYCFIVYEPQSGSGSFRGQPKQSRGYGFAKYKNQEDAEVAKKKMQGADIHGRKITVEISKRNRPRQPTPGKKYCMKEGIQVRRGHHLLEGGTIESLTHDHVLVHQVAHTEGTVIADIIMKKEGIGGIDLDLDLDHTEGIGTATPDRLADDMYTSPTQLNINNPTHNFIQQLPTPLTRMLQNNDVLTVNNLHSNHNSMSKLLQEIKQSITKSRNLAYCGKYPDSILSFQQAIASLQDYLPSISDKTLITQWNRLLEQIKSEKDLVKNMQEVLSGNFDNSYAKKKPKVTRQQTSERYLNKPTTAQDFQDLNMNIINPSFKKKVVHEDDEIYNKKEKQIRERQRIERIQAEQRQRQFQERQAEIWPKKKPVAPKKVQPKKTYDNPTPANQNKSGVRGRQYSKPWLNGAKNASKGGQSQQKKTFLKSVYPDGNGPDANLIEMLQREVVNTCPEITFDDIAELQKAKDVLEEAVLLPLMMPHLFTGIRKAWKGVLLYGPPGTGKTLLAKAIASGGKTTFFNVTSSSVASKWKGDSQKLIRILFQMAKFYSPTTIFIDEIDSLASKRGQRDDQSSRKVKTELMARMDGVSTGEQGKIVLIGASNCPWDIDDAIRRRLQKRIYIPLPNQVGRRQMLKINLKNQKMDNTVELQEIVQKTDGFSGADIANFCREAAYMPMRKKLKKEGGIGKRLGNVEWMKNFEEEVTVPLTMQDFHDALKTSKPSVGKDELQKYEKWTLQFGQQGTPQ